MKNQSNPKPSNVETYLRSHMQQNKLAYLERCIKQQNTRQNRQAVAIIVLFMLIVCLFLYI